MKAAAIVALVLAVAAGGVDALRINSLSLHVPRAVEDDAPWFCHGIDCPHFEVTKTTDKYEVRKYEGGDWATTTVEGSGFTVAMTKGFARLFEYISGANEDSKKMKMTAPVADRLITDQAFRSAKDNYTIAFFIPFDFQGKAPKPTSNDVHIVNIPSKTAYVSSFGGFATEQKLLQQAAQLVEDLKADGVEAKTDGFFWAGYDPPYRLTGRHNEVWVAADKSSVAS